MNNKQLKEIKLHVELWDNYNPLVRHLLHLLSDYDRVRKELRTAEEEFGQLEDRIYCAREALLLLG